MRGAQCILVHYLNILLQFCKFWLRTAHCVATVLHHCSLHCTVQSTLHIVHTALHNALHSAQCKVHSITVHIVHCTLYTAHCTVQSAMHPITVQKVSLLHVCAVSCLPAALIVELHIVISNTAHCKRSRLNIEHFTAHQKCIVKTNNVCKIICILISDPISHKHVTQSITSILQKTN